MSKDPTYGGSLDFGYCPEPDVKTRDMGGNMGRGDEVLRQDTRSNHTSSNVQRTAESKVRPMGSPGPGYEGQTLRGYVSSEPVTGVTVQDGNARPNGTGGRSKTQTIAGPAGGSGGGTNTFDTPSRRGSPGD